MNNTEQITITNKVVAFATPGQLEKVISTWIEQYKLDEKRFNVPVSIDNEIDAYEFYKNSIMSCVKIELTYSNDSKVTLYSVLQCYPEDATLINHLFIDDIYNGLVDISLAHAKLKY
jgi:hypothetical protein